MVSAERANLKHRLTIILATYLKDEKACWDLLLGDGDVVEIAANRRRRSYLHDLNCITMCEYSLFDVTHARDASERARKAMLRRKIRRWHEEGLPKRLKTDMGLSAFKAELRKTIRSWYEEELPKWSNHDMDLPAGITPNELATNYANNRRRQAAPSLPDAGEIVPNLDVSRDNERSSPKTPNEEVKKAVWSHSVDYRRITFKGESFCLTDHQAAIVRLLDQARTTGSEYLSTRKIKDEVKCGKIADSFRAGDGPKIWKNLVVADEGLRGVYRLNLPGEVTT